MSRRPACLLMAAAFVLLAACHPLTTNPAGKLAYPGSKLTYTSPENSGDSTYLTRKYSLASGPTAGQVLAWYTTKLSSYGYHPSGMLNPTSAHMSQRFEDGSHYLSVGLGFAHKLPPPSGRGAQTSAQALREEVSSLTVGIEDG